MIDEKTKLSGNQILASYMDSEYYVYDQTIIEWFQIMTVWFRLINDTRLSHKKKLDYVGSSILTGEIDKAWSVMTAFVHNHTNAKCIKATKWAVLGSGGKGPYEYVLDEIYDFKVEPNQFWGPTYIVKTTIDGIEHSANFGTHPQAAHNFFEYFKLVS